jgi:GT2 family glycosyltransferase
MVDGDSHTPVVTEETLGNRSGAVDYFYASRSGFVLLGGWVDDEGEEFGQLTLSSPSGSVAFAHESVLRLKRPDVESFLGRLGYDFGFIIFGRACFQFSPGRDFEVRVVSLSSQFRADVTPRLISDRRMLSLVVSAIGAAESWRGREVALGNFLSNPAGENLKKLNQSVLKEGASKYYTERFVRNSSAPASTFVTVLFGTLDPMLFQPAQFRECGVQIGEWVYVCNSPEHGEGALRLGKLLLDMDELQNLTIIVMQDNVGFGVANNIGVANSMSDQITLINPDIYPLRGYTKLLSDTLKSEIPPGVMQGGLLFYDSNTLMHSGMYFEKEMCFSSRGYSDRPDLIGSGRLALASVEHFDKGMPFVDKSPIEPWEVPAVTGACMRFNKSDFERINGFSDEFIFTHWEDADLCIRWLGSLGKVEVNPGIRLLHLEGQGSGTHELETHLRWYVNRIIFSNKHKAFLSQLHFANGKAESLRELTGISLGFRVGRL